ncbi:hypothetical protein DUI87_01699 [Hirundo rustica rustica]|uniref:ribonuclease H n=1 Tax=Hirundo rustica rustica TaxID=333673 RepID=A0A3M0L793_HIRRU|nr:hypothetical protein DUI87_01699 [Hirundo rustica rustica]
MLIFGGDDLDIDLRLQLTEGLHLKDDDWNFVSVDNSEQGTWPRVKGKHIVVGDCKHTPKEIEILPGTLDNNPGKFVLWLRCTHPPTFLPKGQIVAQIIPTWEHLEENNIPTACPVHNITEVKPQVGWMKLSPVICQWYVASLLSPVRVAAEKAIIHHYMDDVLVCAPTNDVLSHTLDLTINALDVAGFELQEDKVQRMSPWRDLGLEIGKRTIVPQKLEIRA